MKAVIISIGDELTSGSSLDTNSSWLADRLTLLGIDVLSHVTLGDDTDRISACLRFHAAESDLIVVTGGLGPTEDDRTRAALATAMGVPLEFDPRSWEEIQSFFVRIGRKVAASNRVQAERPQGSRAIANAWGTAPGIDASLGRARVFVMPGVPREMMGMFEHDIEPRIREYLTGQSKIRVQLHCFGISEAQIGEIIKPYMIFGRNPAVGTRAADGIITVRITAKGPSASVAEALAQADVATMASLLGTACFGRNSDTLASVVGDELRRRSRTLAVAESCTGGLLGAALTAVAGSSEYFAGGFLTYSNSLKMELLGVNESSLTSDGAVSDAVAREMASGARLRAGADFALSITGIAGPSGGTVEKPVGTVCIGLADEKTVTARTLQFPSELGRDGIRTRSVQTALDLLRRHLAGT